MKTVILTFFDTFHTVDTFLNFKALFIQSWLRLFGKRRHSVKFHCSVCNERHPLMKAATQKLGFYRTPRRFLEEMR